MILLGAVFSAILDVLQLAPYVGLLAALFSMGYFGSFYLDIISTTMTDRDEVPDWPSFTNFVDDILMPFLRLLGLFLLSFGPVIIVFTAVSDSDPDILKVTAVIGCSIYACLYFPMAVLAAQAFGNLTAALPHVVFPGILKALPGYLLAVGALVLALFVSGLVEEFTSEIPYVGWFITGAITLYGMMFQGRLIGLIYRDKKEKLGWE